MKKKTSKKKQPKSKQKIDVALESLLNLERVIRELLIRIDSLEQQISTNNKFKDYYPKQDNNKYWPNKPSWPYQPYVWW